MSCTFDRWTAHQKAQWRELGFLPLARDTSRSPLRLGLGLLEDVEKNQKKLDITAAAASLRIPWLILHGTEDLIIRFSEAEKLYAVSDKENAEVVALERVGHAYGGADVTESSGIQRVVDITVHWLNEHFS